MCMLTADRAATATILIINHGRYQRDQPIVCDAVYITIDCMSEIVWLTHCIDSVLRNR